MLIDGFGVDFKEATAMLQGKTNISLDSYSTQNQRVTTYAQENSFTAIPEEATENLPKVIDYLQHKRGIDKKLINELIDNKLLYADKYSNAVFINKDKDYAFMRGTQDKKFMGSRGRMNTITTQNISTPTNVYMFESIIDMMSYRDLNPSAEGRFISLQGGALSGRIGELNLNQYTKVYCCFDNDEQGAAFNQKVNEAILDKSKLAIETPKNKDFNEDLLDLRKQEQTLSLKKTKAYTKISLEGFEK